MRHAIPAEFTDEDKWFKFFTKKTLAFMLPGIFIMVVLFRILALFGQGMAGIIIGLVITAALAAVSAIPKPGDDYLRGGGITFDILILRRIIRAKNRVVYVKGY